jgi:hypothetical protein
MGGRKGFFVLFGAPGTWKTTEALMTFQDSLYLASADGLTQFYDVWLKTPEGASSGKRPPKKIVVVDQYSINGAPVRFDAQGAMIPIPQKETFEQAIIDVTKVLSNDRAAGKPPTFPNIIVDEGSVYWERFFVELKHEMTIGRDMLGRPIEKNADGRAHHHGLQIWTREVIDRFRTVVSMGANLVVVCHDVEPDGQKKGGPSMPNQKVSRILGADSHGALLAGFEDEGLGMSGNGSKHTWDVFASKQWTSKIRGIPASRFKEIRFWPLERIIREADFEP